MELDLTECDKEPIHVPGSIQPHGALLVVSPDRTLLQASANAESYLGRPPAAFLAENEASLASTLDAARPTRSAPIALGRFAATIHRSDDRLLIELEPPAPETLAFAADLAASLASFAPARTVPALAHAAATEVRRITGFDRVLIYRFDPDWNGEVIAESLADQMPGFLGHRFPASDIPAQARALYEKSLLRLIPDVDARPSPLVPALDPPTDLSQAWLRAVSPIHLQYLRNLGVAASMSLSLIVDGKLWGLIACHHRTPHPLQWPERIAAELLAQLVSGAIVSRLRAELGEERALRASHVATLAQRIDPALPIAPQLQEHQHALLALADADGFLLALPDGLITVGTVPAEPRMLVTRIASAHSDLLCTDAFDDPLLPGLLALRLASGSHAAWFRREQSATVRWAGDPSHPLDAPLTPRHSFETWRTTMRGRSRPWSEADREAARAFRGVLTGVILRHADELAQLNERLGRSNAELDAFGTIVSHDLKEPLRGIRRAAHALRAQLPDNPALEELASLADRMQQMLEDLFRYARLGKVELATGPTDLQAIAEESLALLRARLEENEVEVRIPRPLPTVICDAVRVREVFVNLLSNAAKYAPGGNVEIGWRDDEAEGPIIQVKDDGIGVAPEFHGVIFDLFRRLHPQERYGGGTGAGLAIVREIVRRHGGWIRIDSAPGQGSTFSFTLRPKEVRHADG